MPDSRDHTGKPNPKKKNATSFKPGQSGNPGGKQKKTQQELDLIAMCREKTTEALKTILLLMQIADKDSVKLSAAQYVIDRGWGKAVQAMEHTGADGKPIAVQHTFTIEFK